MKWLTRLKLLKISKYGIIVCFIVSAVFAAFSIYGAQVGNLTISAQYSNVNLALYDTDALDNPQSRLNFKGVNDQDNVTLEDFQSDISVINATLGGHNDENKRYLAFTFVVQNQSNIEADVVYSINLLRQTRKVGSAIRVMVIEDNVQTIYAKVKEVEDNRIEVTSPGTTAGAIGDPEDYPYMTVPFYSDEVICQQTINRLQSNAMVKFTVILWMEGWDLQCDDTIKGSKLQMNMNFAATAAQ